MNSSATNSESNLLSNASPLQSLVKVKHNKDSHHNKENKLQRFGGAVVNGGTLVFGKIKSLWSTNGTGLNMLADTAADRRQKCKSKENLGSHSTHFFSHDGFLLLLFFLFFFVCVLFIFSQFIININLNFFLRVCLRH